jgi:hypothetical protein
MRSSTTTMQEKTVLVEKGRRKPKSTSWIKGHNRSRDSRYMFYMLPFWFRTLPWYRMQARPTVLYRGTTVPLGAKMAAKTFRRLKEKYRLNKNKNKVNNERLRIDLDFELISFSFLNLQNSQHLFAFVSGLEISPFSSTVSVRVHAWNSLFLFLSTV